MAKNENKVAKTKNRAKFWLVIFASLTGFFLIIAIIFAILFFAKAPKTVQNTSDIKTIALVEGGGFGTCQTTAPTHVYLTENDEVAIKQVDACGEKTETAWDFGPKTPVLSTLKYKMPAGSFAKLAEIANATSFANLPEKIENSHEIMDGGSCYIYIENKSGEVSRKGGYAACYDGSSAAFLDFYREITAAIRTAKNYTHNCPDGYFWGFGGNPTNLTDTEIEALSSCLLEGVAYKPIIYLYPTRETEISVKVSNPQNFTAEYPKYNNGWKIVAQPNGNLREITSGREFYALYYESRNVVPATIEKDGFVVRGDKTAEFLENILPKLGLNFRESQEFIIYWLPILQKNPWNYIRFENLDEINANQQLEISPEPDTVIRVMMSYKPLNSPILVQEQKILTPAREGFTVVEWGGTQISESSTK